MSSIEWIDLFPRQNKNKSESICQKLSKYDLYDLVLIWSKYYLYMTSLSTCPAARVQKCNQNTVTIEIRVRLYCRWIGGLPFSLMTCKQIDDFNTNICLIGFIKSV